MSTPALPELAESRGASQPTTPAGRPPASLAFMNGVHALVHLPILQQTRDKLAGWRTAGFISGYRGSPLGGYDQALWTAGAELKAHDIVFQPGVNEELAVDAVWGTQQLAYDPAHSKFDGVFGIWYGKGPGVDRSGDAFKHANLSGTARLGGALAVAGDDHVSKSSTLAHQSDHTFIASGIPVIAPANVQDILDLGLHGLAMSRYAGLWVGMKTVQEVVESATSVDLDPRRVRIALPEDFRMPESGVHIRWPDDPLVQEARLMELKWPAALAYIRANHLNRNVIASAADRLGIIASGKAFSDVRQALVDLGLDDAGCRAIGLRLHKVGVPWPLEPISLRDFALGLREVLVVEEKRPIIEPQLKDELYHCPPDSRPRVSGKHDLADTDMGGEWNHMLARREWLLRAPADLTPALVAQAIARRLKHLGIPADVEARIDARLAIIKTRERALSDPLTADSRRLPWFCPGCPHNTSTRVPEGSQAMAGIGCHGMAVWMDRATTSWAQMGGEGAAWVGQSPFSTRRHTFANLGDGTYNHSGILAIRQAVAAKANITYKILFNSAVAMTGGQPVDGGLDVAAITRELEAEGVRRIDIVTDAPDNHADARRLAPGVRVHPRGDLDAVQRELREVDGVTALIYDQVCATKKRRERKRGTRAVSTRHVFINDLVCEGCGDCSKESNCVAVQPRETDFGRKRQINQSTCNSDLSCVSGFCPSFVTVEGGRLKRPTAPARPAANPAEALPEPSLPVSDAAWGIVIAGIGGTGVVTIGQILGMAAHLEGKGVVTQDTTGMAQMGGATWSHVQIAQHADAVHAACVAMANADLLIGCDAVVATHKTSLATLAPSRSFVVLNTHATPTSAFVGDPDWQSPNGRCAETLASLVGQDALAAFDAESLATRLLGSSVYANMVLLGHAWQSGRIPLARDAIMRAVEINGVKVEDNKAAFELGRRCAHDPDWARTGGEVEQVIQFARRPSLDALVDARVQFLTDYQNVAYAARYRELVARVRQVETSRAPGVRLSEAVARNLFKLMAYKDEYEVARLHTSQVFREQVAQTFEGEYRLIHHLAPPLLARRNARGELVKRAFGPWVRAAMSALAHMKCMRGTAFDVFGHTAERRSERALIDRYRTTIAEILVTLNADNLALAVEIANLPDGIRGFGHVKARHLAGVLPRFDVLMAQWRATERQADATHANA